MNIYGNITACINTILNIFLVFLLHKKVDIYYTTTFKYQLTILDYSLVMTRQIYLINKHIIRIMACNMASPPVYKYFR